MDRGKGEGGSCISFSWLILQLLTHMSMEAYETYFDEELYDSSMSDDANEFGDEFYDDYEDDYDDDYEDGEGLESDYDESDDGAYGEGPFKWAKRRVARARARARAKRARRARARARALAMRRGYPGSVGKRPGHARVPGGKPVSSKAIKGAFSNVGQDIRQLSRDNKIDSNNEWISLIAPLLLPIQVKKDEGGLVTSVTDNRAAIALVQAMLSLRRSGRVPKYAPLLALGVLVLFPDVLSGVNNTVGNLTSGIRTDASNSGAGSSNSVDLKTLIILGAGAYLFTQGKKR